MNVFAFLKLEDVNCGPGVRADEAEGAAGDGRREGKRGGFASPFLMVIIVVRERERFAMRAAGNVGCGWFVECDVLDVDAKRDLLH